MESEAVIAGYGGVYVDKRPIRILSRHYLVKPLHVYVGGFENAVTRGYIPVKKPVVLGSTGIVRILEAGYGANPELSGSIALVMPTTSNGLLGLELDGLLSKYSTIPMDSIAKTLSKQDPIYSIMYHVAIACNICENIEGKNLLIVGGGIESIALAICSEDKVSRLSVLTLSKTSYRIFRKLGFDVYQKVQDIKCCFDTIFYGSLTPIYVEDLIKKLGTKHLTLYVNPYTIHIGINTRNILNINIIKPEPKEKHYTYIDRIGKIIDKYIRKVYVKRLSGILSLFPINGIGVIISFS
ncbi:MAG: hypothetical protein DRO40_09155 [Thermoprotei archaeon]|nr:MAG: hypothetical protein DRO40_09155 [Thermoprotei archaeon]